MCISVPQFLTTSHTPQVNQEEAATKAEEFEAKAAECASKTAECEALAAKCAQLSKGVEESDARYDPLHMVVCVCTSFVCSYIPSFLKVCKP